MLKDITLYVDGNLGVAEYLNIPLDQIELELEDSGDKPYLTENDILTDEDIENNNFAGKVITRKHATELLKRNFTPIGHIEMQSRAEEFVPNGWALADGRKYHRTTKVGKVLESLSNAYKEDNGVKLDNVGYWNLPNVSIPSVFTFGNVKGVDTNDSSRPLMVNMFPMVYLGKDITKQDLLTRDFFFGFSEDPTAYGWDDGVWYRKNDSGDLEPMHDIFGFQEFEHYSGLDVGVWQDKK